MVHAIIQGLVYKSNEINSVGFIFSLFENNHQACGVSKNQTSQVLNETMFQKEITHNVTIKCT